MNRKMIRSSKISSDSERNSNIELFLRVKDRIKNQVETKSGTEE